MPDNKSTKIDYQVFATTIMGSVEKMFISICSARLDGAPKITKRAIVEWRKRMKVYGFEKFKEFCYISVIKYYLDPASQKADKPFGVVILYIELPHAYDLLAMLKIEIDVKPHLYEGEISEEDKAMAECCGEFCNIVAGSFKTDLAQIGYPELIMSTPENYVQDVPEGIIYPSKEQFKYELAFKVEGKRVFVDVVMPLF